jgi:hypothetical protein
MEELSLFDHLVRELDTDERRALLVRMQSALPSYPTELAPQAELENFEPDAEMGQLGLFRRLIFGLSVFFTGRDRAHLLRELYLRRLGEKIRRYNPDLIDFRALRFLPGMLKELAGLAECARYLRGLLEGALGSQRRAFVAFLARDELRGFQVQVMHDTDPEMLWKRINVSEKERKGGQLPHAASAHESARRALREEMLGRYQRLVDSIPEDGKRRLYRDSAALNGLHSLATFDFDTLRAPFKQQKGSPARSCPLSDLLPSLRALAESLSVIDRPPSPQALYDLVVFSFREQLDEPNPELERRLRERLADSRKALEGIRRFHERVPLTTILRYVSGNPYYLPRVRGGGEDWFLLYQELWRRRVHQAYLDFVDGRRREELKERCRALLAIPSLREPENYHSNKFGTDTPVRHSMSLALVQQFYASFAHLQRPLRLIYLNGEFFREENRREFRDAFHFFDTVGGKIGALEVRLGPSGDLRAAIQAFKDAQLTPRLQSVKIREVLIRADIDARAVAEEALLQLRNMAGLLRGILKGRPGDRFDSIANLTSLGGRENRELTVAWERAMDLCEQTYDLLDEILTLEMR